MFWYLLAAGVVVVGILAGHFLSQGLYWIAALSLIAVAIGTVLQLQHQDRADESDDDFIGGCAPFNIFAQNQFAPFGTLIWVAPEPTAERAPGFSENEIITVDGWVAAQSPYASSNTPPWNADRWFHLSDGRGWVTYAGVRAAQTVPDPEGGFGPGSDPAPLDPECQGTYRASE